MPLTYRTGDLFAQDDLNCIAHQANHWNTLLNRKSSGIASKIEKLYPEAADADTDKSGSAKLGTYSAGVGSKDGRIIFNIYSQHERATSYDAMVKAFTKIEERIAAHNSKSPKVSKKLGIPYGYGSNIAIGYWSIVESVFKAIFQDSSVECVIVRLPGQEDLK